MQSQIIGIFPKSLYTNDEYQCTEKEKKFIKSYKNYEPNHGGNLTSKEKYLLDSTVFQNLKEHIEKCVDDYSKNILCIENKLRISISWINKNVTKTEHHVHSHPNSFLSGVFYFQESQIKFHNETCPIKNQFLHITPLSYTPYNSEVMRFSATENMLILFPSTLLHSVEPNFTNSTRYSLSFNTFLTGKIGDFRAATELNLN